MVTLDLIFAAIISIFLIIGFVWLMLWDFKELKPLFQCPEDRDTVTNDLNSMVDELNLIIDKRKLEAKMAVPEDKNLKDYTVVYLVTVKVKEVDEIKALEAASDLVIGTIVGDRQSHCFGSSFVLSSIDEG